MKNLRCEVWSKENDFQCCTVQVKLLPCTLQELRELARKAFDACEVPKERFALLTDWEESPDET